MIRFTPAILAFISVAQAVDIESKASNALYSGGPHLIDLNPISMPGLSNEPNHAPYPNPGQVSYPNPS